MSFWRMSGLINVFIFWLIIFIFMMIVLFLTQSKAIIAVAAVYTLIMIGVGYMQDKQLKRIESKSDE